MLWKVKSFILIIEQLYNECKFIISDIEIDQEIQFKTLGVGIHSITGSLKNFFKNLSEPLIPVALYDELYKCAGMLK